MRNWEDGGGVRETRDVQGVLCTWLLKERHEENVSFDASFFHT